jgi:hypothetical protein
MIAAIDFYPDGSVKRVEKHPQTAVAQFAQMGRNRK